MITGHRGFSLIELLVSMAIVLAVTAAMFGLVNPAHGVFDLELERIDMQQRVRASADAMFKELLVAGAGRTNPPVAPFRRGERNPDAAGSAFADRLSIAYIPRDGTAADRSTITYWLRTDPQEASQLMRYDGRQSDLPLADHVSGLRFEYSAPTGT